MPEPPAPPDAPKPRRPAAPEDLESYRVRTAIRDRSHRLRAVVNAWKKQQEQDRELRSRYARWLMLALAVQAVLVNVVFVLLGTRVLTVEEWTARTFIAAVFAEIAAMVLVIVKYLFHPDQRSGAENHGRPGTRRPAAVSFG